VGNSIHISGSDKLAGFYHGLIKLPDTATVTDLTIYNDKDYPLLEYGYPNISYCDYPTAIDCAHDNCQSIITVNYSASDTFPGFGTIFYDHKQKFSSLENLRSGNTSIRVLYNLQRWGDYSGTQPMYGEPGRVWASGTFGKIVGNRKAYGTWVSELSNPTAAPNPVPEEFTAKAFPNPPENHQVFIEFEMPETKEVQVEIVELNGRIVDVIYDAPAHAGKNLLTFSTLALENGLYIVRIRSGKDLLYSRKITVVQ
jgi:hypothetical protein